MNETDKRVLKLCEDFIKDKKVGVLTLEVKPNKDILFRKEERELFKLNYK